MELRPQQAGRGAFKRSPLSLSVPLEGTDTTPGLRSLERAQLKERLLSNSRADSSGLFASSSMPNGNKSFGASAVSSDRGQYAGPYARDITVDDLKQEPRPWSLFFTNGERGRLTDAYSIPRSVAALQNRAEENFVFYLPNYLRLMFIGLLITFYVRPRALLAVAAMLLTLFANLATVGAPPSSWESTLAPLAPVLMVLSLLLATWTRCISLLLRWLMYGTSLTGLHACMRRTQSEHRVVAGGQAKRVVNPLAFLWRRQAPSAQQQQQSEGSRWQLFRELYQLGVGYGWHACMSLWAHLQYSWYSTWDNLWATWRAPRTARAW